MPWGRTLLEDRAGAAFDVVAGPNARSRPPLVVRSVTQMRKLRILLLVSLVRFIIITAIDVTITIGIIY